MPYTPTVWQDLPSLATPINAARLNNMETGIANATAAAGSLPIQGTVAAAAFAVRSLLVATDTQPAFQILGNGTIQWGPGGSSAIDATLSRKAVGYLGVGGGLLAAQGANNWVGFANPSAAGSPETWVGLYYDAANSRAELSTLSGGVAWRNLFLGANAKVLVNEIDFGTANANFDTSLYRASAGVLTTGGEFRTVGGIRSGTFVSVASDLYVDNGGTGSHLYFGGAADTNLYRLGAGILKTDGSFQVGSSMVAATEIAARSGSATQVQLGYMAGQASVQFGSAADTNLYRSAAGVLKTDGVLNAVGGLQVNGVPVSGSGGGMALICDLVLGAAQSSFDTNTILGGVIPTTYKHLMIVFTGRVDTSPSGNVNLRFNNDSGTNYDSNYFLGRTAVANVPSAAAPAIVVGECPGTGSTAGTTCSYTIFIPNYNGAVLRHSVSANGWTETAADGTTASYESIMAGGLWRTIAAITRVQLLGGGGSWVAGSRFTLYGLP